MAARTWNRRRFVTASLTGGARVRWNAAAGKAEKA